MKPPELFYRQPGKSVMGPLPLKTLIVAMNSGSLSRDAEVSKTGNDPWIPLVDVVADGLNAFGSDTQHTSENPAQAKRPIIALAGVSLVIALAVFVSRKSANSQAAHGDGLAPAASALSARIVDLDHVKSMAEIYFSHGQSFLASYHSELMAENKLAEQRTAGEAALKTIELQKAMESRKESETEYRNAMLELKKLEQANGIEGQYSKPIEQFVEHSRQATFRYCIADKYRGILAPETKKAYNIFHGLRSIMSLDLVISGDYLTNYPLPD